MRRRRENQGDSMADGAAVRMLVGVESTFASQTCGRCTRSWTLSQSWHEPSPVEMRSR